MAVESDTDRLSMLSDWDSALYNGSSTISGIFDNEYLAAGVEVGIESSTPAFTCRSSDVPSVAHDDTLVINTVSYVVRGIEPDGTGITVLLLHEA